MIIWHNTRCSKSRCAIEILQEKGIEPTIVKYLEDTPTAEQIKDVLKKAKLKAVDIIRTSESLYKQKYQGKKMTEAQWIKAMVEYPILIERPIVINGDKAIVARPPEKVLEIL